MSDWLLDPRLAQCRRVFLRDVQIDARIGVQPRERHGAQRLRLSVDLFVALSASTPARDQLAGGVDYDFVREVIRRRIARGHINLQETLVDDLSRELLERPDVAAVRVSTEKLDVYEDVGGVGVEVMRFRQGPP
jgi:7,8-dihydroneopterin aldolase/epimerase/oxygenase